MAGGAEDTSARYRRFIAVYQEAEEATLRGGETQPRH
jgi:hypothetical protein